VAGDGENSTKRPFMTGSADRATIRDLKAAGTTARHRRARRHMQVQCTKCSRPIALTDIIESSDGRLSHVECDRPQTLTPEERSLIFTYCSGHAVAQCLSCNRQYRFEELAAGLFRRHTNMCPRCGTDLTESVRAHLFGCAMAPSEVRVRAQEVREAAQRLVKQSQQTRDRSDVPLREAEAALFERQRDLREAMSRRTTS